MPRPMTALTNVSTVGPFFRLFSIFETMACTVPWISTWFLFLPVLVALKTSRIVDQSMA